MFNSVVKRFPRAIVTEAAYRVARVLFYFSLLTKDDQEEILWKGTNGPIPSDVREAVSVLLAAIENDSGQKVQSLTPVEAAHYLNSLYEMLDNLNATVIGSDSTQGRRLLSDLREANP